MKLGKFITFEGPDGCGKSTLAKTVAEALGQRVPCVLECEPTQNSIGKLIREHSLHNDLAPQSFLFLFLADRYEHIQTTLLPALQKSQWVILDRYMDSTWAYQSAHCQMGVVELKRWLRNFKGFLVPDRTYLLKLSYDAMLKRIQDRKRLEANDRAGQRFYEDVAERFYQLAKEEARGVSARYKILDATQSVQKLTKYILQDLESWI